MSTITRERLLTIQQWRETYGPGSNVVLPAEEADELARIALERMDAKAVAWTDTDELRDVKNGGNGYLFAIGGEANKFADPRRQVMLYTTPPAPVSVPTFDEWLEIRGNKPLGWVKDAMRESYDVCRDAMLQGAEPVTTAYKLPPHIFRELVNRLRDTAVKYQGCQQLREQLSRTLQEVIQPVAPQQGETAKPKK